MRRTHVALAAILALYLGVSCAAAEGKIIADFQLKDTTGKEWVPRGGNHQPPGYRRLAYAGTRILVLESVGEQGGT